LHRPESPPAPASIPVACLIALALTATSGCKLTDRDRNPSGSATGHGQALRPNNRPPQISGSPPGSARVSAPYDFTPSASDGDGDPLRFEVLGKPSWAMFDTSNGRLYGTPPSGAAGRYDHIRIIVTDGTAKTTLPAFAIVVRDSTAAGAATLRWVAPAQMTSGEPLTDLAGFRVYYGQSFSGLDQIVTIPDARVTQVVIESLAPGTWFFAVTAYTSDGTESVRSNVVSKGI